MITIKKKSLKVGKYVNTEHVDTIVRNYKQERWIHNSERLGKADSLSAWYSIEELQEFMERAKENGGDGVRIYFAAYPTDYPEKPEYAGRQTVVFVATKQKITEAGVANKDIYVQSAEGPDLLGYNSGLICPPICNPRTFSAKGNPEIGIALVDQGDKGMTVI